MLRAISLVVALVVTASVSTYAQNSIAGAWDLSINGPEGAISATATLKQDGDKVTGQIESPQGTAELSGTLKGKVLNMSFSIQGPNGPLDIKVNGEVDGANMKGIIDFGMGMADFTAKKK
jgi:hypothetical protein